VVIDVCGRQRGPEGHLRIGIVAAAAALALVSAAAAGRTARCKTKGCRSASAPRFARMTTRATVAVLGYLATQLAFSDAALTLPKFNLFGRDDMLTVYIKRSNVCSDGNCLQPLELWHLSSPSTRVAPSQETAVVRKLPVPDVCTLPFTGLMGLGQLTLSMDGRFATLGCYRHPPGTALTSATEKTVIVISADGSMNADTHLSWPGVALFSTVTDNSTFIWLAGSDGKLRMVPVGGTSADEVVLLDLGPSTPIRHVTINTCDSSTRRSEMWLSAGEQILRFKTIIRQPLARWEDYLAEPPILIPSTRHKLMPIYGFDDGASWAVNPRRSAYGHAVAMFPRGGKLYPTLNDPSDTVWSQPDSPTTFAGHYAFFGHANNAGVNAQVFRFNSSLQSWRQDGVAGFTQLTIHSGFDVLHIAASLTRYPTTSVGLYDDRGAFVTFAKPIAQVLATSPMFVFNYSVFDLKTRGTDTFNPTVAYAIPIHERKLGRFGGICFVPLAPELEVPLTTALPSPSVFPSPPSTPSSSNFVTPSPASPSVSPSFAFQASGDLGQLMGSSISFSTSEFLILLRIGDFTSDVRARLNEATFGTAKGYGPSGTSDPLDFQNMTALESRLAQPLHIDIYSRITGALKGTVPLPTKRTETHAACTAPFSFNSLMWPRLSMTEGGLSIVLGCYE
jgi:hypothetical protein